MIHPTAIVDKHAELDSSVEVGPWCLIGPHVKIGAGTKLMSHVVVENHTEIGANNTFFPFSVIGAVPQDLKYKGEPSKLIIGNRNVIRESVTLNIGTEGGGMITSIADQCLLMAYAHVGHDSKIGSDVILANSCAIAGHVEIQDYAILGGLSAVAQFVRIGKFAYIGGHSGIEKSIPPFAAVVGSRPKALRGANIVGLKRRGFKEVVVMAIHESIKIWSTQELEREAALNQIEEKFGRIPEIQEFIAFIRKGEGVVR